MKKATWLFSSVIAALLTTGAPAVVSAAESSGPGDGTTNLSTTQSAGFTVDSTTGKAEAESIAQIDVQGGSLILKQVPNLSFESVKVQDLLARDVPVGLNDEVIKSGAEGYDGNDSKTIEVDDFRGTNIGWKLDAKLGKFKLNDSAAPIIAKGLSLNSSLDTGLISGGLPTADLQGGATIIDAKKNEGTGQVKATVDSATLTLPKTSNATKGTYRATITWTLSTTPEPQVEGGQTE